MARKQKQPATVTERASNDSDIRDKLRTVTDQYVERTNGDPVTEETRLREDCAFDSLDLVELCIEVEDEFGTEIPDADMERFATVGDVLQWLVEHRDECVQLSPTK